MDLDGHSPRHSLDINEKMEESAEKHGNFESISTPPGVPLDRQSLTRHASDISRTDARDRYEIERADNRLPNRHSASSLSSGDVNDGKQVISWEVDDPENPYNWSFRKKMGIVIIGILSALNSTLGSSLPSNAIPYITADFGIHNSSESILPISVFLIGYIFGPLFFGPLSETYGRRSVFVPTFTCLVLFTMGCALAPTWPVLIILRLCAGICASAPVTLIGGLYADIYNEPVMRGRVMSLFMAATGVGPIISPILSGFVSAALGWRWTFWIGLIMAGVCWVPIVFFPETYGPVLLSRRAQKLRKSGANTNIYAQIELEKKGFKQMATVTLTRPIRMLFFEPIVAASCAYLALAYGIFYMYFEAYPIIFGGIYGMSSGVSGLMFLPIGIGMFIGVGLFLPYDGKILAPARAKGKSWSLTEEARRLPLAFVGGPLYVVSLFWMGWTAKESIHWIVPALAGLPFGIGFIFIFIALLNYLTDAYDVFAASAMAAAGCTRSIAGVLLPLAASPMYTRLGVAWASSLLGFLSLVMCIIPFIFFKYGEVIRSKSKFCVYLKELKEKEQADEEAARAQRRRKDTSAMNVDEPREGDLGEKK